MFNLPPSPAPAVVLDTNTVLDWLVFKDACMAPVVTALQGGTLRWLACAAMRDELARTLAYRTLAKWLPDSEHVLATFDRHVCLLAEPPPSPQHMRCSDPNDQIFLDLALAQRAQWLLTHDRALLRLARRARPIRLLIVTPKSWPGTASPS